MSARLLLPLVMLPVLGIGVALALTGWLWSGFGMIAFATIGRIIIRRSAPYFILTHALDDERFYEDVIASGVLSIAAAPDETGAADGT
jgi:hypothetical protein